MKSIAVVLVMIVTVAVICKSAAISKQQRDVRRDTAADDLTSWLPGGPGLANKRYVIPTIKHRTAQQKRHRTVSGL